MNPDQSHGWVIPRPDGKRARCGGPEANCYHCKLEKVLLSTTDRAVVMEGFNIRPGDRILLMAPPNMPPEFAGKVLDGLKARYTDVEFTMIQGFTGVQVKEKEDDAPH